MDVSETVVKRDRLNLNTIPPRNCIFVDNLITFKLGHASFTNSKNAFKPRLPTSAHGCSMTTATAITSLLTPLLDYCSSIPSSFGPDFLHQHVSAMAMPRQYIQCPLKAVTVTPVATFKSPPSLTAQMVVQSHTCVNC